MTDVQVKLMELGIGEVVAAKASEWWSERDRDIIEKHQQKTKRIQELEGLLQTELENNGKMIQTNGGLRKQLNEANELITQLTKERDQVTQELKEEKEAFTACLDTCKEQDKKCEELEELLKLEQENGKRYVIRIGNLQTENQQSLAKAFDLAKEKRDLEGRVSELAQEVAVLKSKVENEEHFRNLAEAKPSVGTELAYKQTIAELKANRTHLELEISELETNLKNLKNTLHNEGASLHNSEQRIVDLEKKLLNWQQQTENANGELNAKCRQVETLKLDLKAFEERNTRQEACIAELRNTLERQRQHLEAAGIPKPIQINFPTPAPAELVMENIQLVATLMKVTEELKAERDALQLLQEQNNTLSGELEAEIQANNEIAEELGRVQNAQGPLTIELKAQKNEVRKLVFKLEEADHHILTQKKILEEKESEWESRFERLDRRVHESETAVRVLSRMLTLSPSPKL